MLASELIVKLQERITQNGDGPVFCHDGLDPSDPAEITEVKDYAQWDPVSYSHKVIDPTATYLES